MQRCLQVLSHAGHDEKWADLRKIIEATDPDAVLEHGTYTRPAEAIPDDGWGKGRVTLLGDAAHPLRPTGGLRRIKHRPLLELSLVSAMVLPCCESIGRSRVCCDQTLNLNRVSDALALRLC